MFFLKKRIENKILFILILSIICVSMHVNGSFVVYAKLYENKEVEKPVAEDEDSVSENIIYDNNKSYISSPLTPTPSSIEDTPGLNMLIVI